MAWENKRAELHFRAPTMGRRRHRDVCVQGWHVHPECVSRANRSTRGRMSAELTWVACVCIQSTNSCLYSVQVSMWTQRHWVPVPRAEMSV